MQFKPLSPGQRRQRWWELRRNRLVCKLLEADKNLLRYQALALANRIMGQKK